MERPPLASPSDTDGPVTSQQPSTHQRLGWAAVLMLLFEVIGKFAPLWAMRIALGRIEDLSAFGYAQYLIWVLELSCFFIAAGYTHFGSIQLADRLNHHRDTSRFHSSLSCLRLFHLTLVLIVWFALFLASSDFSKYGPHLLLLSFVMFTSCIDGTYGLIAQRRMSTLAWILLVSKAFPLVATYLFVLGNETAWLFAAAVLAGNAIVSITTGLLLLRQQGLYLPSWREMRWMFWQSLPFAAATLLLSLLDRYELYFIERDFGLNDLGSYSLASRLMLSLQPMIWLSGQVFFSETLRVEPRKQWLLLRQTVLLSLCFAVLIILNIQLQPAWFLSLIFSQASPAAQEVLGGLSWGLVFFAIYFPLGHQWLCLKKRQIAWTMCLVLGVAVGFASAESFGQQWGLKGTALSPVVAKATVALGCIALLGGPGLKIVTSCCLRIIGPTFAFAVVAGVFLRLDQPQPLLQLLAASGAFATGFVLQEQRALLKLWQQRN